MLKYPFNVFVCGGDAKVSEMEQKEAQEEQKEETVIRMEQIVPPEPGPYQPYVRYRLELVFDDDTVDWMEITHSWVPPYGGYIRRTITFNFLYRRYADVEIEVKQTRFNVSGTGIDFEARFMLPPESDEDILWPFVSFINDVKEGKVTEENLAKAINEFLKDLRECVSELAETYLSLPDLPEDEEDKDEEEEPDLIEIEEDEEEDEIIEERLKEEKRLEEELLAEEEGRSS